MKLVKPSYEIMIQEPGITGLLKHIELCGRTAYKSEGDIKEGSAEKFVNMLIKRGHGAVLEHGTIYLTYSCFIDSLEYTNSGYQDPIWINNLQKNKYTTIHSDCNSDEWVTWNITTNYRVLVENGWLDDLEFLCEPTINHEKRITVRFICDRGVSHEFVRHRVFSFVQESTRYCNYSKEKFGNRITYIIPEWLDIKKGYYDKTSTDPNGKCIVFSENADMSNYKRIAILNDWDSPQIRTYLFFDLLSKSENSYRLLLENGWTAQQARSVLPNSLKTELIMTGTVEQWKGFFKLRCATDAHPSARELAIPLKQTFIEKGLL